MDKILIITKKIFQQTVRGKAFIIITILGPFLIFAMVFLNTLPGRSMSSGEVIKKNRTIKILNVYDDLAKELQKSEDKINVTFINAKQSSKDKLTKETTNGSITGFIEFKNINSREDLMRYFSFSYYSKDDSPAFDEVLQSYVGEIVITERLKINELDREETEKIIKHPDFESITIEEKGEDKKQDLMATIFTLIGFIMLLYMSVVFYGQIIGRSIVEEKTSKTVEIMLSSVRPIELMTGKIIGLGLVGLLQYGIWILISFLTINYAVPALGLSIGSFTIDMSSFGFLLLFFVLTYFLYSSGFAAIGAAANDVHNMGQLIFPLLIPLILTMVSLSAMITSPDGAYIRFLSFFPFTAPLVMFGRILMSNPPVYEILISIALVIATTFIMIYISSKIFRVGILMSGKKVTFKEIFKWITYK